MQIRWKTLATLSIITLLVTISFYFITEAALLQRVANDERAVAKKNLIQFKMAVNYEEESLISKVSDWSNWDDTYEFVANNNSQYIKSNLCPQAFEDLKINIMLFKDNSGSIVYNKAYSLTNMTEIPLSQNTLNSINSFLQNQESYSNRESFLKTEEGVFLLVARPIFTSSYEGPPRGMLVFGELFDQVKIQDLTAKIGLSANFYQIDDIRMTPDFLKANATLSDGSFLFTLTTDSDLLAYTTLRDVNSSPVALVSLVEFRQAFSESQVEILYLIFGIVVIGLIFLGVTYLSLDKFVISRLSHLNNSVHRIYMGYASLTDRVSAEGNDEISELSNRINDMLDKIGESQSMLAEYASTLEKRVEQKRQELEEANQKILRSERMAAIGELAGMVAHDLRNPLAGVKNAVYVLRKRQANIGAVGISMLDNIDQAVEHADSIINDLLDYSREIHLQIEEHSSKALVDYALLSVKIPSNISIKENIVDMLVRADANKVQRVFVNLIKNAIEAMPNGGYLTINSDLKDSIVEFSFIDNGSGMSEETLEKIFTPLFTTKAQGMGLGLSICKRLIEAHGGNIEVESVLGKGTKFTVSLPSKKEKNQTH